MTIHDKILVVEDDRSILKLIKTILTTESFEVLTAQTGAEALSVIHSHCPDLIILDLCLPDMNGNEIIQSVRKWSQLPIIVLSALSREQEKVDALENGADDYITKPFSAGELVARTRVALRHTRIMLKDPVRFSAKGLLIDYDRHTVEVNGEPVHLTQNEFRILVLLSKHSGKVLTYDFIIRTLWGPRADSNNQILRVNMANIRRKIEENPAKPVYIFTEAGVGYRMLESD
ncbi:MAG: response regulator transcription factor [Oscillospiraceae bacterium]|nr:response regulator transcription factor [Oscillospiraceae bacterium]